MAYTIIQTYDPLGTLSTLKEFDICMVCTIINYGIYHNYLAHIS